MSDGRRTSDGGVAPFAGDNSRNDNPSVWLDASQLPLRTETAFQAVPVLRMAYFLQTAHCAVCRKTLMLQVRCANPTGNFAPKRPFGTFRCCAWLIFRFRTDPPSARRCFARLIRQAETLELQPHSRPPSKRTALSVGKRACFRFAALTLRVTLHRNDPSGRSGVPHSLFSVKSTSCSSLQDAHPTDTGEPNCASLCLPCVRGGVGRTKDV